MFFNDLKMKYKNLVTIFAATFFIFSLLFSVALIVFVGASAINKIKEGKYIGQDAVSKNTITVSATGEVYAKPDLALLDFSVTNEAKAVDQAMKDNTLKMNRVIGVIKGLGVEEKDLKTTTFRISPRYEWRKEETAGVFPYPQPEGKRVLVGYEVYQTLHVKIRDMEKIGEIIKEATLAGANQVGGLQFTIDKPEEFQKEAREQAIEKAKTKAKELASQLGVSLGRITNFSEGGAVPRFYSTKEAVALGGVAEVPMPSIEIGENKIEVSVNITYEIN